MRLPLRVPLEVQTSNLTYVKLTPLGDGLLFVEVGAPEFPAEGLVMQGSELPQFFRSEPVPRYAHAWNLNQDPAVCIGFRRSGRRLTYQMYLRFGMWQELCIENLTRR